MLIKGKKYKDYLSYTDGKYGYAWPEYEGRIDDAVMRAIDAANALTPRKGGYIDPYYRAMRDVADMGVVVYLTDGVIRKRLFVER